MVDYEGWLIPKNWFGFKNGGLEELNLGAGFK